ncbi:MAG: GGDEF domain-containing protein [Candidatus Competibacteraceae bacterium]|nr:GGDEF domain-containing protein [Candidatus Competibacteraceae bacterium]
MIILMDNESQVFLSQTRLFHNVDKALIADCVRLGGQRFLQKGNILLDPEHKNDCLFVVFSGCFGVYLSPTDDRCLVELSAGECVGEVSVLDQINPSAYVIAESQSQVLALSSELLWSMLAQSLALTRNLLCILTSRIRQNNAQINNFKKNANIDTLTGLYNRRWLEEVFKREQRRISNDSSLTLCLIMIDVDHFKRFNDRYGHLAGDKVLERVAATLRSCIRPRDVVVRFGGEEFVVMLPNTLLEAAVFIAERIAKRIRYTQMKFDSTNAPVSITVSAGVAKMLPVDSLNELVNRADSALYEAKRNGRDQVCYSPTVPR